MRFVVDGNARGRLLVTGPEGPAFLHRMSTQHVTDLKPGDARLNTLTTDKGRIKDLVHHVVLDSGVLLIGHRLSAPELSAWLDRYFFTEKLALDDVTERTRCVEVDVDTADELAPGARALGPWQMAQHGNVVVVRGFDRVFDGAPVPSFVVVGFDGAALPAPTTPHEDDVRAAVAAGVPGPELSEAHTPLDLDLHDAIHWAKGCYIGQEVIARLDTYGKQKKHLGALVLDVGAGAAFADVAVGNVVQRDGVAIGAVTSVAPGVAALTGATGAPRALCLVKGEVAEEGVDVVVVSGGGPVPARLVKRRAEQAPHT